MAGWTTLHSPWVTNEVATAAELQAITDNINFLGALAGTTVLPSQTTTSTTFTDLITSGPTVTLTTGTKALVHVAAVLSNDTAGAESYMGFAVSGASTIAPDPSAAVMWSTPIANGRIQAGYFVLVSSLTAGVNTFTGKYLVTAGTGTFGNRRIAVVPLP